MAWLGAGAEGGRRTAPPSPLLKRRLRVARPPFVCLDPDLDLELRPPPPFLGSLLHHRLVDYEERRDTIDARPSVHVLAALLIHRAARCLSLLSSLLQLILSCRSESGSQIRSDLPVPPAFLLLDRISTTTTWQSTLPRCPCAGVVCHCLCDRYVWYTHSMLTIRCGSSLYDTPHPPLHKPRGSSSRCGSLTFPTRSFPSNGQPSLPIRDGKHPYNCCQAPTLPRVDSLSVQAHTSSHPALCIGARPCFTELIVPSSLYSDIAFSQMSGLSTLSPPIFEETAINHMAHK